RVAADRRVPPVGRTRRHRPQGPGRPQETRRPVRGVRQRFDLVEPDRRRRPARPAHAGVCARPGLGFSDARHGGVDASRRRCPRPFGTAIDRWAAVGTGAIAADGTVVTVPGELARARRLCTLLERFGGYTLTSLLEGGAEPLALVGTCAG